jgi:16S rRNA (uracil1498-N3)-methyltransferase
VTAAPAEGAAHVFVGDLDHAQLDPGDRHHLERVLRIRRGEAVTASDGAGRWRRFRYGPALLPNGEVVEVPAPVPVLTVALALTKGHRPELVVQKLTELGVDRIAVFPSARSVARWEGERAERHLQRLRRVAREAAMQSRRVRLPTVVGLEGFAAAAALPGAALADRDGGPPTLAHPAILVGPEGGWTPEERAGRPRVALSDGVLRAETAAIVVGTILTAMRDGRVGPTSRARVGT